MRRTRDQGRFNQSPWALITGYLLIFGNEWNGDTEYYGVEPVLSQFDRGIAIVAATQPISKCNKCTGPCISFIGDIQLWHPRSLKDATDVSRQYKPPLV